MHYTNTIYVSVSKILEKEYIKLASQLPKNSQFILIALEGFNWKQSIPKNITVMDARLGLREVSALMATMMLEKSYNRMLGYYKTEEEKAFINDSLIPQVKSLFWISLMTTMTFAPKYVENSIKNLKYIRQSPSVNSLYGKGTSKPAIIVGAGPSLNKNIHVLKTLQDKAIIIAAGSAMGALHENGITPDLLCASDAGDYDDLDLVLNPDTILVAAFELQPKVCDIHKGKKVFFYSRDEWTMNWAKQYIPTPTYLQQNISVSTAAFNLAMMMGCNPIIMVGQDLAFSGDEHHADGVVANDYQKRQQREVEVEGYDGGMVKTVSELKDVAMYLASAKLIKPNIRMINATEGGAKVLNFEQMKLEEVGLDDKIDKSFIGGIYDTFSVQMPEDRFANFLSQQATQLEKLKQELLAHEVKSTDGWLKYCKKLEKKNIFQIVKQVVSAHNLYIYFQQVDGTDEKILLSECQNTKDMLVGVIDKIIKEFENLCQSR